MLFDEAARGSRKLKNTPEIPLSAFTVKNIRINYPGRAVCSHGFLSFPENMIAFK